MLFNIYFIIVCACRLLPSSFSLLPVHVQERQWGGGWACEFWSRFLERQLHCFLCVRPWASDSSSLGLRFLICPYVGSNKPLRLFRGICELMHVKHLVQNLVPWKQEKCQLLSVLCLECAFHRGGNFVLLGPCPGPRAVSEWIPPDEWVACEKFWKKIMWISKWQWVSTKESGGGGIRAQGSLSLEGGTLSTLPGVVTREVSEARVVEICGGGYVCIHKDASPPQWFFRPWEAELIVAIWI